MSRTINDILVNKVECYFRRYRDVWMSEQESIEFEKELLEKENQYKLNDKKRDKKIIVSFTSFPARFENVHFVVRSMLLQTFPPDEIILYLDDDVVEELPASLLKMKKYGLKIEKRCGNMKPHKKYYYAIKEHPDDIIITIDDDILYAKSLIENLYSTYLMCPDCVIATRAHKMKFNKIGELREYNAWKWAYAKPNKPSMDLLATGVGGVLYPPHCMYGDLFKEKLFLKLAPKNDDIWLKFMQVLNGTKVVVCNRHNLELFGQIPGSQTITLNSENVHENKNDEYIKLLMNYYKIKASDFMYGKN